MDSRALAAAGGALIGGLVVAALLPTKSSPRIQRIRTEDPRMSGVVVHNGVVMISGQVGNHVLADALALLARTDSAYSSTLMLKKMNWI